MSFANRSPRLPSHLDIVVIRKEGADQYHYDFRVRCVVHRVDHEHLLSCQPHTH